MPPTASLAVTRQPKPPVVPGAGGVPEAIETPSTVSAGACCWDFKSAVR